MIKPFLLVCLGGALGSGLRYLLSLGLTLVLGQAFPYATLAVNVVGSFLLGVIVSLSLHTDWLSPLIRLTLITGVLGGLTTYSTFNHDTLALLQQGAWGLGCLNILLTVLLGLLAGLAGLLLGQWVAGLEI